jgi:5-methyltetrahydrofolate--homocysteine methyltransferase
VATADGVLLPAMREVVQRFSRSEITVLDVLGSAEVMRRCLAYIDAQIGPSPSYHLGRIVIATLTGDVHDIGRALLVTVLSTSGYLVHDLGKQVPVDVIVDAAVEVQADAVGLSALLIETSKQMPRCIQELDRRDVHVPVLLGGAAINRAFGRRAGILPDGRIYEPAVFYCRDVFEGLSTMDALRDPIAGAALVDQVRAEIASERAREQPSVPAADGDLAARSATPLVDVPRPPFWGSRRLEVELEEAWTHLDRNTLFRHHWGGYRARGADYDRLVTEIFEPQLRSLMASARADGWLVPLVLSGYFPVAADGQQVVVFDPADETRELTRLQFPRQRDGERLCLADYFRPLDDDTRDVLVLQAVSTGPRGGQYVEELQRAGQYRRMLYVNGLAAATAEALAEYAHQRARREMGLSAERGLRFSWGYAACPDLHEQHKVLPLLRAAEQIGLTLSSSDNLDPEHSTAALIVHHPAAKYFSVRPAP